MSYKSFELLHKLYFVRTGGSAEEKKAAEILKAECESLGVEAAIETFKVDGYNEIKSSLKFINPDMEIECVAVGMSSSTPEEGITGEFTYVDSLADAEIQELEGKVCLVHSKLVNVKLLWKYKWNLFGKIICAIRMFFDLFKVSLFVSSCEIVKNIVDSTLLFIPRELYENCFTLPNISVIFSITRFYVKRTFP